jgi:hypothetical protein
MDTQNVSAQLYFKQLPEDPSSGKFGCFQEGNNLSTCVNGVESDAQIENTFQQQLNLTEYYKSPAVFNTMKRDFMDKTMDHANQPPPEPVNEEPTPPPAIPSIFFNKSNFSDSDWAWLGPVLGVIIAFIIYELYYYWDDVVSFFNKKST